MKLIPVGGAKSLSIFTPMYDINGAVANRDTKVFSARGIHLTVRVCEPQAEANSYGTVSSKCQDLLGEQNFPVLKKSNASNLSVFFTGKTAATKLGTMLAKLRVASQSIVSQSKCCEFRRVPRMK
jgi:hypothetical protein